MPAYQVITEAPETTSHCWGAHIPDLPNACVVGLGDTRDEALASLAMSLHLVAEETGIRIAYFSEHSVQVNEYPVRVIQVRN